MKIVKKKKASPSVWSHDVSCRTCKAILRLGIEDLTRGDDWMVASDSRNSCFFNCASCGDGNSFLNADVPEWVWQRLVRAKSVLLSSPNSVVSRFAGNR